MSSLRSIIIISATYQPEPLISARMSFDLAKYLANAKYDLTVLCPQPSRPLTANYEKYLNTTKSIFTIENMVKVVRLPSFVAPQSKLLLRMRESFSFGWHVTKYLASIKNQPDVLYVNSWPLFSQYLIVRYAKRRSIPLVLQIMDIYPESLTNRSPAFFRFLINAPLRRLDAWIAGSASKVIVISKNMHRTYVSNRQLRLDSVATISTWQDEAIFDNIPPRSTSCKKYNIPLHPFTFLFLGNIGPVAGVDLLIRAFSDACIADAQLLIIGDGTEKLACERLANELNVSGVHFISDPEAANVPVLQSMADVCMLPVKRHAGMSSIPSKLPSYLFSAKPVIASVDIDSDTAQFIREAECGWVGEPEDCSWLAIKMKEVSALPREQLESLGHRGRKFGLLHFSKSSGVAHLANEILQVAGIKV